MNRRVVITGIGVVAPGGVGTKEFWSLLTAGRTATRGITLFDASPFRSRIAAEADFDPIEHGFSDDESRTLDRAAQFAIVSAAEALEDSGLTGALDPLRTGVTLGSAVGCTMGLDREYNTVSEGAATGRSTTSWPCPTCSTTSCPARWRPRWPGGPVLRDRSP